MDQGVRLAKAGLLVAEYYALASRVALRHGVERPASVITLVANLRTSILTRLRRLSLLFAPIGARECPFYQLMGHVEQLCREGDIYYQRAQLDIRRPLAVDDVFDDVRL
jgi:hypothetical protein